MKMNISLGIFIIVIYFIVCAIVANIFELTTIINYILCAIGLLLASLLRYLFIRSNN